MLEQRNDKSGMTRLPRELPAVAAGKIIKKGVSMGLSHHAHHPNLRSSFRSHLLALLCLIAAGGVPASAWAALAGDQNKTPELCQGIAGAAYSVNVVLSIAAPPPRFSESILEMSNRNRGARPRPPISRSFTGYPPSACRNNRR